MRIGIIAALPGELRFLVRGWEKMPVARGSGVAMWRREQDGDEVIAVCGGMGATAARRAFAAAEFRGALDMVLSVGWAGALTEDKGVSPVMSEIVDAQTGEPFALTDASRRLRVVTTATVAGEEEKHRLRASYGAVAVEMEAATVARLAQMRGIPMCCFKAISDGVDARLPDFNPFIDSAGKLRMKSLLTYVAMRPRFWGAMIEIGSRSSRASRELATLVERFLLHKDFEQVNRTGVVR